MGYVDNNLEEFVQNNSPDGGFLQSEDWRSFQENAGSRTFHISSPESECQFWANIISYSLPVVGSYLYIPRGPVFDVKNSRDCLKKMSDLIEMAKKENAPWIRFDANDKNTLEIISSNFKTRKAPHDMQPREIFMIDITKSEDELLEEMKSKTRYNIRLGKKKGIKVFAKENEQGGGKRYLSEFLRLVKLTSARQGIISHSDNYYRKMLSVPGVRMYVAEYDGKIIAANFVFFYGKTATYLHGASDSKYRKVMAPFVLQWKQIRDAKKEGCEKYDFGGVSVEDDNKHNWQGITRFKLGFSPETDPIKFPGSYDIVIDAKKYYLYRALQKVKSIIKNLT